MDQQDRQLLQANSRQSSFSVNFLRRCSSSSCLQQLVRPPPAIEPQLLSEDWALEEQASVQVGVRAQIQQGRLLKGAPDAWLSLGRCLVQP